MPAVVILCGLAALRAALWHPLLKWLRARRLGCVARAVRRRTDAPATPSGGGGNPADLEVQGDTGLLAFRLSEKYAGVLSALAVCLICASVIPLLYVILMAHCVVVIYVARYELFHLASTPPLFDGRLARAVETMMPFAVVAHVAFAIVAYAGDIMCIVAYLPLAMVLIPCCCCGTLVRVCGSDDDDATVQDVNMAVPYQQFWAHAPYIHPLRHVYRITAASESWQHPMLQSAEADGALGSAAPLPPPGPGALVASPSQVSMFGATSHALGRVPGACIADRVDAFHTMQRTVQEFPHLLEQVRATRRRRRRRGAAHMYVCSRRGVGRSAWLSFSSWVRRRRLVSCRCTLARSHNAAACLALAARWPPRPRRCSCCDRRSLRLGSCCSRLFRPTSGWTSSSW